MRKLIVLSWLALGSLVVCGGGWAMSRHAMTAVGDTVQADLANLPPTEELPLAKGRIIAVDQKAGRVTLDHGPVVRLALQPEIDVFYVADPASLTGLSPGDKIRFEARRTTHHYVITRLENAN
ncbi:MAG TPA: copper-binding protein [Reyranella sp.]|nr:copper-binding protein [Reyranella sp.]